MWGELHLTYMCGECAAGVCIGTVCSIASPRSGVLHSEREMYQQRSADSQCCNYDTADPLMVSAL